MSYRPLPESLTIKKSELHGLGVFAIQPIPKDTCIGQSHLVLAKQIYRTPIGGFINHSDDPNCIKEKSAIFPYSSCPVCEDSTQYVLKACEDIDIGDELTVDYTFYKI